MGKRTSVDESGTPPDAEQLETPKSKRLKTGNTDGIPSSNNSEELDSDDPQELSSSKRRNKKNKKKVESNEANVEHTIEYANGDGQETTEHTEKTKKKINKIIDAANVQANAIKQKAAEEAKQNAHEISEKANAEANQIKQEAEEMAKNNAKEIIDEANAQANQIKQYAVEVAKNNAKEIIDEAKQIMEEVQRIKDAAKEVVQTSTEGGAKLETLYVSQSKSVYVGRGEKMSHDNQMELHGLMTQFFASNVEDPVHFCGNGIAGDMVEIPMNMEFPISGVPFGKKITQALHERSKTILIQEAAV
jgi:F0F1-type ATP synthase membrane subunit b/b'